MLATPNPVCADTREHLIRAAREVFLEEGYRASIDRIAAHAGVARQTLYNHFSSKSDLFGEVARQFSESILVALDNEQGDVGDVLRRFAEAFRNKVLGEEGLAIFRILVAEAGRFPELAQAFYAQGPCQTTDRLASFLVHAMQEGRLRRDDPRIAAEMLLGMLINTERNQRLFGISPLGPAAEKARVERIVEVFLRAYAPERKWS